MSKIRRLYSYKGEFIGLENYKYLRFFYNDKGELRKPSKKTVITTSTNALMLSSLLVLSIINIGGGLLLFESGASCVEFLELEVLNQIFK